MNYRGYYLRAGLRYAALEALFLTVILQVSTAIDDQAVTLRGVLGSFGLGLVGFSLMTFLFSRPKRIFLPMGGVDFLQKHLHYLNYEHNFSEGNEHWYRNRTSHGFFVGSFHVAYEQVDNTLIVWGPRRIIDRLDQRWKREYSRRKWPDHS